MSWNAALPALGAALLFGASTPLAKRLVGDVPPLLLAGLLYLGSGIGLGAVGLLRRLRRGTDATPPPLPRRDWPWLAGAIMFGGVLGPALLMRGLVQADAATASLLLNVEGVLTALLAWIVFRENADRRIVAGMAAIVAGGVVLAWPAPGARIDAAGAPLIVAACLAWAIDNNLTRKVSAHDAVQVAGLKGLVAGLCNTALALGTGATLPSAALVGAAMAIGFLGYGISLTLFVVALRTLGTARAGAYFSVAPLVGVAVAWTLWPALPTPQFMVAAALMAVGVWLHVTERHDHTHTHEALVHAHRHDHDEHHRHDHAPGIDPAAPHDHRHAHEPLTHRHPHHPDIHHRHRHAG